MKEKDEANQTLGRGSNAVIFLQFNLVVCVWVVNVGGTGVIFRVFVLVVRLCDGLLIDVGRKVSLLPIFCWAI